MIDRIRLISDLHLEFSNFTLPVLPDDETTLLILAGDIATYADGAFFIKEQLDRFPHIIYIMGNHEYYGSDFTTAQAAIQESIDEYQISNRVTLAGPATKIEFEGFRVLAGTLWTNMNNNNVLTHTTVGCGLYDFRVIKNGPAKFTTEDVVTEFSKTINQFTTWLEEDYSGKTIIATHHMPSDQVVDECFKQDYHMNGGFRSDLDEFIKKYTPSMWLFGHTHSNCDIILFQTRLLCNPRGYPRRNGNYENLDFNPNLTILLD